MFIVQPIIICRKTFAPIFIFVTIATVYDERERRPVVPTTLLAAAAVQLLPMGKMIGNIKKADKEIIEHCSWPKRLLKKYPCLKRKDKVRITLHQLRAFVVQS